MIFPFFFWMFPILVYKVDDPNIAKQLKAQDVSQEKTSNAGLFGPAIGISLAGLLKPLIDYFDIPGTQLINSVILAIILVFIFLLCASVNNLFKKRLRNIVYLEDLVIEKLWVRPESIKHFFFILFYYLFGIGIATACYVAFIEMGNIIMLMIATFFLLVTLFISSVAPVKVGNTKVKFKKNKKVKV